MGTALIPLYGSLGIQPYGLCIAAGIVATIFTFKKDSIVSKYLSHDDIMMLTCATIASLIIGTRLLFIYEFQDQFSSFWEFFTVWDGGLSIQGGTLLTCIVLPSLLIIKKVPVFKILDRIFNLFICYSIARLGCFFAGCCYGISTTMPWGITYTNQDCLAPCFIPLHPTQLYSSLSAACIFLLFYLVLQKIFIKRGQLLALFFIALSLERFFVDFLRADHTINHALLSTQQYISLGICGIGCIIFTLATFLPLHVLDERIEQQ